MERVIKGDRWQSHLNWYLDDVQTVQLIWDHQKADVAVRSFSELLLYVCWVGFVKNKLIRGGSDRLSYSLTTTDWKKGIQVD